jgi:hypothetical protein
MAEIESDLERLRAELAAKLETESTSFEAILRLAGETSKHQPNVVRFSTDAVMVCRLERELVAKQETALGELVQRARDADATLCAVTLTGEAETEFEIADHCNGPINVTE